MADVTPTPPPNPANEEALAKLRLMQYGLNPADVEAEGHKFGLPDLPLQRDRNTKHRYDDVINQITKLMMRDGKLAKAQRVSSNSGGGVGSRQERDGEQGEKILDLTDTTSPRRTWP